jgi:riboflavin synthase
MSITSQYPSCPSTIDIVGKYVEKSVQGYFAGTSGGDFAILEKMVNRI